MAGLSVPEAGANMSGGKETTRFSNMELGAVVLDEALQIIDCHVALNPENHFVRLF